MYFGDTFTVSGMRKTLKSHQAGIRPQSKSTTLEKLLCAIQLDPLRPYCSPNTNGPMLGKMEGSLFQQGYNHPPLNKPSRQELIHANTSEHKGKAYADE